MQETSQFTASQYLNLSSFSTVKLQEAINKKSGLNRNVQNPDNSHIKLIATKDEK